MRTALRWQPRAHAIHASRLATPHYLHGVWQVSAAPGSLTCGCVRQTVAQGSACRLGNGRGLSCGLQAPWASERQRSKSMQPSQTSLKNSNTHTVPRAPARWPALHVRTALRWQPGAHATHVSRLTTPQHTPTLCNLSVLCLAGRSLAGQLCPGQADPSQQAPPSPHEPGLPPAGASGGVATASSSSRPGRGDRGGAARIA